MMLMKTEVSQKLFNFLKVIKKGDTKKYQKN